MRMPGLVGDRIKTSLHDEYGSDGTTTGGVKFAENGKLPMFYTFY